MKIAVLGTGMVGRALAGRLVALGHDVAMGTRDPAATLARTAPDGMGNPPLSEWLAGQDGVRLATFADAAAGAELLVLATSGAAALGVLDAVGPELLRDRIVLDVTNPLDHASGMPPRLFVSNDDSLGEQLQRAHPEARVVKSLNTMNAFLMIDPRQLADGDFTTFVSGDDAAAKAVVSDLLAAMGHRDVVDLGDISTARGPEMTLPLWLRLWGALGGPMFNLKVVR